MSAPPDVPADRWCEHHYCRCMRAEELALLADRTGNPRWLAEAVRVHGERVRCRLPTAAPAARSEGNAPTT